MRALILALLKNDDDGEMKEMTDCIQKKEQPGEFRREDVKGDLAQVALDGTFDELIITGHSRCLHAETLAPLEMKDRRVGGYPVDAVSDLLKKNILKSKFKTISLWCCEAALSTLSRHRDDRGKDSVLNIFSGKTFLRMKETPDAQVSIVERLACDLWDFLSQERYVGQQVVIRGLNGVGDVKEDGSMKTFDQQHLKLYNELSDLKKNFRKYPPSKEKEKKEKEDKIKEKEAQIDQVVRAKQSCHIYGWKLQF